jgi:periplasmic protein TonB
VTTQAQKYRFLPLAVLAVVVLCAAIGVYLLVRSFLNAAPPPTKKVVQEIHVIRPPPPPPDEPPPPPPPEEKVDVHEPDPEPDPTPSNEPPQSEQLGLDAEGGAGGDAFGLVGNKGGRDLLASGGNAFAWYGGLAKNEIASQLQAALGNVKGGCSVKIQVWIKEDGSVQARATSTSGDQACSKALESHLTGLTRISQAPPRDMPQPIQMRIDRRV